MADREIIEGELKYTEAEASRAFEWLRTKALDDNVGARYAAIALCEVAKLKERDGYVHGDGWISVEDRMPPDDREVLVHHVLGDQARSPRAYDVGAWLHGKWVFPWDREALNPPPQWVTHWMPLPSAPGISGSD